MAVAGEDNSGWPVRHSLSSCNYSTDRDMLTRYLMGIDGDGNYACHWSDRWYYRGSWGLGTSPTVKEMRVVYHLKKKKRP